MRTTVILFAGLLSVLSFSSLSARERVDEWVTRHPGPSFVSVCNIRETSHVADVRKQVVLVYFRQEAILFLVDKEGHDGRDMLGGYFGELDKGSGRLDWEFGGGLWSIQYSLDKLAFLESLPFTYDEHFKLKTYADRDDYPLCAKSSVEGGG